MPRIRSIKPDFFKSEDVSALPLRARLTWIGLWTHCDDHGRTKDNTKLIKGELWPLDDVSLRDIEEDLAVLAAARRIVRYQVQGKPYLAVLNWHHHQVINRPGKAKHPAPPIVLAPANPDDPSYCPECAVAGSGALVDGLAPAEHYVSEPRETAYTQDSVNPHGAVTDGSKPGASASDAHGAISEPSVSPHGVLTRPEIHTPEMQTAGQVTESVDGGRFREPSVNPHGAFTEGSHQERKGKEGKGGERGRARETAHSPPNVPRLEPPLRCPQHLDHPTDQPCGPCRDARQANQSWQQQQAQAASLAQQARAQARADATRADIDRCGRCDDHGRIGGRLCAHDPGIAERAKRGAALARAAITKPDPRANPTPHHEAVAAIDAILAESASPPREEQNP